MLTGDDPGPSEDDNPLTGDDPGPSEDDNPLTGDDPGPSEDDNPSDRCSSKAGVSTGGAGGNSKTGAGTGADVAIGTEGADGTDSTGEGGEPVSRERAGKGLSWTHSASSPRCCARPLPPCARRSGRRLQLARSPWLWLPPRAPATVAERRPRAAVADGATSRATRPEIAGRLQASPHAYRPSIELNPASEVCMRSYRAHTRTSSNRRGKIWTP